jgi:hypothetical protein
MRDSRELDRPNEDNGRIWNISPETTMTGETWVQVAFGNGIFVAVSETSNNTYATSVDGVFWTKRTMPVITGNATYIDIAFANGQFVAVAQGGTNANFRVSTDGINWTPAYTTTPGSNLMERVVWADGQWTACGRNTSSQQFYSYDGYNWLLAGSSLNTGSVNSMCFGKGQVHVLTGSWGSKHYVSTDKGLTYAAGGLPAASEWKLIRYDNGIFIAFGIASGPTNVVYTSPDGTNWTQRTYPTSTFGAMTSLAYGDGVWVAATNDWTPSDAYVMRSVNDGVTWNLIDDHPVPGRFNAQQRNAVGYGDGVWVCLSGGTITTHYSWWSGSRRNSKEGLVPNRLRAEPAMSFTLPITAALTVTEGHRGCHFNVTANTFSITLTAAATLRNGFAFSVFNSGSGTVTIDADAAETIRDATSSAVTKTLTQGEAAFLMCDGTGWEMMKFAAGSGSGTINSGTAQRLAYYSAATTLDDTDSVSHVYIGTATATPDVTALTCYGVEPASCAIGVRACNNTNYGAEMYFSRGRGTLATPTAIQSGDVIARIRFGAYVSNSTWQPWYNSIRVDATENWTNGAMGTSIALSLCPNGGITSYDALTVTTTSSTAAVWTTMGSLTINTPSTSTLTLKTNTLILNGNSTGSTGVTVVQYQREGTVKAYLAVAGVNDHFITGALTDDMVFRSQGFGILFSTDSGTGIAFQIVAASGGIKTSTPSGGTAGAWKLGIAASVSPTSPNRTIQLDVGGTLYYLHAKTTND